MNDEHSSRGVLAEKLTKLLGLKPKAPETIKALQQLISESHHLLHHDAASMINGVLQVSEMSVSDIMIPRSQMVVLEREDNTKTHLGTIVEKAHSRFPVIDGSMDKIAGVLLAKDLLHWCMDSAKEDDFDIEEVLRPAIFVPESKRLNVMLREFRDTRNHMAIVVDEYGGTTGIVTIEDVLEQIVGDITDEHDVEDANQIMQHSNVRFTVKAHTSLEEFNEYFKSSLALDEINTIGGFVVNSLGHLPKRNEVLSVDKFKFRILRADKRRVHLLQVNLSA